MAPASQHIASEQNRPPMVSVILTVYKRTGFLEAAIRSVLLQTLADLELIVTDDADTEEARRICALFSTDVRLRYRVNPQTLGTPLNVAATLGEARGTYVCILNDDDLLYPHMLEHLAAPLEAHHQVVTAFGNHDVIDANGEILADNTALLMRRRGRIGLQPGLLPDSFGFAVRHNLMVGMGCLFRRAAASPSWLDGQAGGSYDYWMAVKLGEAGPLYFVPEKVMAWRRHADSVTATCSRSIFSGSIFIYETLLASPLTPALQAYCRNRLARFLKRRAQVYLDREWDEREARACLYRAWRIKWASRTFLEWVFLFLPAGVRRLLTPASGNATDFSPDKDPSEQA
ncbi:MAG: glycosyltransferase family 2 protein [Kiritimatiellia bacterium]